ncbi:ceramide glucosyltransferase [Kaistia dalseonensis]|uniref:Ceramide glucosyltransferase n=1 Tax=Kaistia dalseonensis TaxID=410840 RepID=A0ABU0H1V1_9HYPH|nr:ceramide glucosyltransferase [Kaistia dalseonensis]MCX5493458.1 ceramide glucosyltransferase [Kaistia dalseonensis]MDQ0436017.1 ceramide glucosyltransferase [Kaistia dalseonensis]
MTAAIWVAGAFCIVTSLVHFVSIALVTLRGRFAGKNSPSAAGPLPVVSILRPVCGIENAIERTLRSGFELDYPEYELVFCVASETDPVIPLVRRLMAEYSGVPARILIGDDRISINPKLNNLVKGWQAAEHDWVVMADSNVLMPPDYLTRMLDRWSPSTGLVCSPPLGSEPDGAFAEFECAFLNTFQARWQLAADAVGNGFAQGKTMFWRRENLDRNGGIEALAADPAEDAAATKVIRGSGLDVRLVYLPFPQPLGHRSLRAVWHRQLRWARLRRVTFPIFFCMEFFVGGMFPILSAAFLSANDVIPIWSAAALAVFWYGMEALMAKGLDWHCSWKSPLAWILRDVSLPLLWINAVSGNGFEWRGNQMNVKEDSLMVVEAD